MKGDRRDAGPALDGTEVPGGDGRRALYSLKGALQDLATVFAVATVAFVAIVLTGLSEVLLGWADAYPRLEISEAFVYGILVAAGFGVAVLRRWMQLTEVARRQEATRRKLERKAGRLRRSNRELERVAYAASHDLREPLRRMESNLGLLERELGEPDVSPEVRRLLGEAREASDRMDRTMQSVLEYTRLEPDADGSEPTDADRALSRAVEGLASELHAAGVEVEREPLPAVRARPGELELVFEGLIHNALVHGGPEVDRVRVTGTLDGDEAALRVVDDGNGFDAVDPEEAFEILQHGNGSTPTAGAGMGLALCRRVVERHGGQIRARPELGEGAGFEIRLEAVEDTGGWRDGAGAGLGEAAG